MERVPWGILISYSVGRATEAIKSRAFETFLFFYYVQVLELPGTLSGAAIAIALVFDGFTDPVMGSVSDRFHSRWGRRHPFFLMAAPPLAIAFVLLFMPPESIQSGGLSAPDWMSLGYEPQEMALFLWLTTFAVLTRASMTLFHVPHLAVGAELSPNYIERTRIVVVRVPFGVMGSAAAFFYGFLYTFRSTPEFETGQLNPEGYPIYAVGCAIAMILCIMVTFQGTKKVIPFLPKGEEVGKFRIGDIFKDLRSALTNYSFRMLFFGGLIFAVYGGAQSTLGLHMLTYFWGVSTFKINFYAIALITGAILPIFFLQWCHRRFDKKPTYIFGITMSTIIQTGMVFLHLAGWFPTGTNDIAFALFLFGSFLGTFFGILGGTGTSSMMADVVDEHELNTGRRQEGAFFGAISFIGKSLSAGGHLIGGIVIDVIEWPLGSDITPDKVPPEKIWELGFAYGPLMAILPVIAIIILSRYNINRERHAAIRKELEVRRNSASAD